MPLANSTQNITSTASKLGTVAYRIHLSVLNPTGSGATIYIGGPGVAQSNATYALAAGDPPWIADNAPGIPTAALPWYAVTASGTATGVCVVEGS